jgi:hypothetical protein
MISEPNGLLAASAGNGHFAPRLPAQAEGFNTDGRPRSSTSPDSNSSTASSLDRFVATANSI